MLRFLHLVIETALLKHQHCIRSELGSSLLPHTVGLTYVMNIWPSPRSSLYRQATNLLSHPLGIDLDSPHVSLSIQASVLRRCA